jgi:hypothetical protein
MPPPSVWGPPLWTVLHEIGPLSGRIPSLCKDSERECIWLLNHLEYVIPCKECIDHLIQFRRKNPIPKSYTTIGEWVCRLHNSVNEKLGKEIVEYSELSHMQTGMAEAWELYLNSIKDSILLGLVAGDRLREFARHMLLWMQYSL